MVLLTYFYVFLRTVTYLYVLSAYFYVLLLVRALVLRTFTYFLRTFSCVYTKDLLCIHKRISCVYTRDLLCMHNTLVHALGQGTQGPGPKKGAARAWDRPKRPFWALAPGFPGPEHAQECCACTRDLLCTHKRFFCVYTRDLFYVDYAKNNRSSRRKM